MPNLASSLNDRRMKKEDEMNIDAKYNSFARDRVKDSIQDGNGCAHCRKNSDLQMHHYPPKGMGGKRKEWDFRQAPLCIDCHAKAHSGDQDVIMSWHKWAVSALIEFITTEKERG